MLHSCQQQLSKVKDESWEEAILEGSHSLEALMDMLQGLLILAPLGIGRIDEVRVELVLSTSHRDQAMSTRTIDLIDIVNLPLVILLLLGLDAVRAGYQILQLHIRQSEVVQHHVHGCQLPEARQEGQIFLLGLLLRIVELTVSSVGSLLYLGNQPLLPSLGDVVHVLCGVLLA